MLAWVIRINLSSCLTLYFKGLRFIHADEFGPKIYVSTSFVLPILKKKNQMSFGRRAPHFLQRGNKAEGLKIHEMLLF